jgi:hypothetical protein
MFSSRPLLEDQVRAWIRALPGVTLKQSTDIIGLTISADRRRVTGVQCHGSGQCQPGLHRRHGHDRRGSATARPRPAGVSVTKS